MGKFFKYAVGPIVSFVTLKPNEEFFAGTYSTPEGIQSIEDFNPAYKNYFDTLPKNLKTDGYLELNKDLTEQGLDHARRHEMMHWKRYKQGKMKHLGEPSLLGLGTTIREEALANIAMAKMKKYRNIDMARKIDKVIDFTLDSTRAYYPSILKSGLKFLAQGKFK